MDRLSQLATRPLTPFEHRAVECLRGDDDVVVDNATDHIRMVGSLRAGNACLKCHAVQPGALLGALSYELFPVASSSALKAEELVRP